MIGALGFFGIILLVLVFIAIFAFLFVFWILMIIDCVKRDFKGDNDKVAWILVLVFLGFLGAAIYYFVVKANGKAKRRK